MQTLAVINGAVHLLKVPNGKPVLIPEETNHHIVHPLLSFATETIDYGFNTIVGGYLPNNDTDPVYLIYNGYTLLYSEMPFTVVLHEHVKTASGDDYVVYTLAASAGDPGLAHNMHNDVVYLSYGSSEQWTPYYGRLRDLFTAASVRLRQQIVALEKISDGRINIDTARVIVLRPKGTTPYSIERDPLTFTPEFRSLIYHGSTNLAPEVPDEVRQLPLGYVIAQHAFTIHKVAGYDAIEARVPLANSDFTISAPTVRTYIQYDSNSTQFTELKMSRIKGVDIILTMFGVGDVKCTRWFLLLDADHWVKYIVATDFKAYEDVAPIELPAYNSRIPSSVTIDVDDYEALYDGRAVRIKL